MHRSAGALCRGGELDRIAVRRLSAVLTAAALILLGGWGTARAQVVDAEQGFATRIAQERTSRGLAGLSPDADLQAVARRHAQRMAERGHPYHNPDLATEVGGWSMLAENVGMGGDVETIHQRFMASTQHRDIILSPDLTQVGVGVVRTEDGTLWVVEVFRRPMAAPAPAPAPAAAPAPPPPPPAPAPVPTTQPPPPVPTTAAPATTVAPPPPPATPLDVADGEVAAASGARLTGASSQPAVVAPVIEEVARRVPTAAWVAAFLLAFVVGLQGQALRRLGLLR